MTASGDKWLLHAIGADDLRIEGFSFRAEKDHVIFVEDTPGFTLVGCKVEGGTKESVLVSGCDRALIAGLDVSGPDVHRSFQRKLRDLGH